MIGETSQKKVKKMAKQDKKANKIREVAKKGQQNFPGS